MKKNIIRLLLIIASACLGSIGMAQDASFKVTLKSVSIYGSALKPDEILKSESLDGLKFVFKGTPIADNNQKAIQLYVESYKLVPGKYNLHFKIKSLLPKTSITANMMGIPRSEDGNAKPIQIGSFKGFPLTGEWLDAVLPIELKGPMQHAHLIFRVGAVAKGNDIYIAPEFSFSRIH